MSQMFFSFNIESLKGNKWSFTVEHVFDEQMGMVYRVSGKLKEDDREGLFTFESIDLKSLLYKIENILERERMFDDE